MEQVRIASLALDPRTNQPVVLLKPLEEEPGAGRLLPIWIGHPEATAILLALEGVETPRPMTHDLVLSLLGSLETLIERVEITRVDEGTFYAAIILRGEEAHACGGCAAQRLDSACDSSRGAHLRRR